mmetsp:Transcript_28009/g.64587  ORF Transcript_28009/g.64587 Transcript_28009/m.64587 type:complete len:254 (+) Transcript_28009:166-927(+)
MRLRLAKRKQDLSETLLEVMKPWMEQCSQRSIHAEICVVQGKDPRESIVDACEALHASLLVVGARALQPVTRALLGSTSDFCVQHAPCSILVARENLSLIRPAMRRVAIALEPSMGEFLLSWAQKHLLQVNDYILFLHCTDKIQNEIAVSTESWPATPGVDAEVDATPESKLIEMIRPFLVHVRHLSGHEAWLLAGEPRAQLDAAVSRHKIDLLVVGARRPGTTLKRLLLGSVSNHCVRHSAVPVVVVRSNSQ